MDLEKRKEKLTSLQKKWKKKKIMAILLALFTFGVNTFAWFVFSSHVRSNVDVNVSAWDVEFMNENEVLVQEVYVAVTQIHPGMTDYTRTFTVRNKSDVDASFTYDIVSLTILGRSVDVSNLVNFESYLENTYPFSIEVSASENILGYLDTSDFEITVSWDYETTPTTYFALNSVYDYNPTFVYYEHANDSYTTATVTDLTYTSLRDNLYLEKDDADTYFGMMCGDYESTTGDPCIELEMLLTVEQINS